MTKERYRILTAEAEAELEVKKSRFIAELRCCRTEEEAKAFHQEIKKKHYDARHHCFAFRIGGPGSVTERFSDDGEPQGTAGKPMLELLKGAELYDVCAVVTRYFGGTLLGTGGLVRAYAGALSGALSEAEETGRLAELQLGQRFLVRCDYNTANRLKYFAEQADLFPEAEEYTELCTFYYLIPEALYGETARKITEMSAGRAEIEALTKELYYRDGKPKIYKSGEK